MLISEEWIKSFPDIKPFHWNPNWNGGYYEYFLQINNDEQPELQLSVKFARDYSEDPPFMVSLVSGRIGQSVIRLFNITTQEQFVALYMLLRGNVAGFNLQVNIRTQGEPDNA